VEVYDCFYGGEVELIEEIAREHAIEYDYGGSIGWSWEPMSRHDIAPYIILTHFACLLLTLAFNTRTVVSC